MAKKSVSTLEMTREEWLQKRAETIGSSDIGAILGLNHYATPTKLYREKVGIDAPFEGNNSTEWGTELEDFCARMFEKKNPDFFPEGNVEAINTFRVQRDNKIRVHPDYPWATCNLDRLIVGGKGAPVILELKTTTSYAVKNWDAAIPTSYYAQVQWQLFVTGYQHGIIWVAVLDKKEFIRADIERSDEFIDGARVAAEEFLSAVKALDPSKIKTIARDTEMMAEVAGTRLQASELILKKIQDLTEIKQLISEMKKTEKELADDIKVFLGDNEALVDGDRVLATYATVTKKAFTVPASTTRVLNIQRERKGKKNDN